MSVERGGDNVQRLYLKDDYFDFQGEKVVVKATNIPGVDMEDVRARHKARYAFMAAFCSPGAAILDFPCGSGFGSEVLSSIHTVNYTGWDNDHATIGYAQRMYPSASFKFGDMTDLPQDECLYDVIGCIEGLHCIPRERQDELVAWFEKRLKPDGVLVITLPDTQCSGKSTHNEYHLGELVRDDFLGLLKKHFSNVELVTKSAVLSTGVKATCLMAVCHMS